MAGLTITYRDGTVERKDDNGAPGGSYCQTVRYEGEFAIITDAYGAQVAIPMDLIQFIHVDSPRRW